jgi:hypothetical protein
MNGSNNTQAALSHERGDVAVAHDAQTKARAARATEARAAGALLGDGIRVPVGRHGSIVLRQPTIGCLLAISREYLKMGVDADVDEMAGADNTIAAAHRLFADNGRQVCRIAATGYLGKRWKIRLFTGIVARWLRWRMTPAQLRDVMLCLVTLGGVQDFMNTIRFIRMMTLTTPKKLSPEEDGSVAAT